MDRALLALLALAFVAGAAPIVDAQTARQVCQKVEASMLIAGHVDIDRGSTVSGHAFDQPEKLPAHAISLIERAIPTLRFEPVLVDGAPALARAKMSVRLVATPVGDREGSMNVRIASAHFGDEYSDTDRTAVRRSDLRPPRYPMSVAQIGGKGTVYLLVKVGRDGAPEDVVAEQVNLTAIGNARQMQRIRDTLSKTAIDNARRHWTFIPPAAGDDIARDYWVVRVPVQFSLHDDRDTAYGQWSAYHPGRQQRPAWAAPTPPGFSPDTLVAGDVTPETSRFRLLTPFEG